MGVAVATPTLTQPLDNTQHNIVAYGTIAVTASTATYATGGVVLDFSKLGISSSYPPFLVTIKSEPLVASPATAEYIYTFLPGTTLANGKLQIYTGAAAQSGRGRGRRG